MRQQAKQFEGGPVTNAENGILKKGGGAAGDNQVTIRDDDGIHDDDDLDESFARHKQLLGRNEELVGATMHQQRVENMLQGLNRFKQGGVLD